MRRALLLLPRLLAASVLALLFMVGVLTLAQPALGGRTGGLYAPWARPLVGVQLAAPPLKTGVAAWLGGETQAGVDGWVNTRVFQRPAIVRAFNTAQWQLFGTSYMANGTLVRGGDDVLFELSYIGVHCGFDWKTDLATLPAFARRLKATQDAFEARGQRFVYLVAAVKTPPMAEHVPPGFACPADRRDHTYRPAVDILRAAGVHVVDTRAALSAARAPAGLYPRNGIHWNRLGAAIAARALVDELRRDMPALPPLTWTIATAPDEAGGDRDLADLLNLWRDPPGWPAPIVTLTPASPAPDAPTLAAVNDSFFGRMADILREAGTFGTIRAHGYLTLEQIEYAADGVAPLAMDRSAIRQDLLAADIVVLEEVESRLGGPFAVQFLDLMDPALGPPESPPRGCGL